MGPLFQPLLVAFQYLITVMSCGGAYCMVCVFDVTSVDWRSRTEASLSKAMR